MNDAERMITVAELLRREGFKQSAASRKRQKLAVAATGVVALAGATVTGMLVLAPKLSTSFSTEEGQLPVTSGNGGSAATRSSDDARKAGPTTYADVTTMAAVRQAAEAPEPPVRIPAMSQIDRGAPAGERVRDSGRNAAEPAPARTTTRQPAAGSEKAPSRDDERRHSGSAESTESQDAQQPADEPSDDEARQSEPEQPPSKQKPEREKQAAGSDQRSDQGAEKGSDQGKGAGNGKGR